MQNHIDNNFVWCLPTLSYIKQHCLSKKSLVFVAFKTQKIKLVFHQWKYIIQKSKHSNWLTITGSADATNTIEACRYSQHNTWDDKRLFPTIVVRGCFYFLLVVLLYPMTSSYNVILLVIIDILGRALQKSRKY